jgi:hypothetical protein
MAWMEQRRNNTNRAEIACTIAYYPIATLFYCFMCLLSLTRGFKCVSRLSKCLPGILFFFTGGAVGRSQQSPAQPSKRTVCRMHRDVSLSSTSGAMTILRHRFGVDQHLLTYKF